MSDNNRMLQHIYLLLTQTRGAGHLGAPLAAIALFCIAAAMAPPAQAQVCGAAFKLQAKEWSMVGVPCEPPVASRTIGGVFGPNLGNNDYGVTWIAWKRVYDDGQCVVSSGPADCYVKLTLTSPANVGDAFWIYTTKSVQLQFPSSFKPTPGPQFTFPGKLATGGNSRYYMFANPYGATLKWSTLLFAASAGGTTLPDLTTAQAVTVSIVSKNVHYWNGNTYFTRDLGSPEASFDPKEAAWLEMLTPSIPGTPGITGVTVKVPQP